MKEKQILLIRAILLCLFLALTPSFFITINLLEQKKELNRYLALSSQIIKRNVESSLKIAQISLDKIRFSLEGSETFDSLNFVNLARRYYALIPGIRAINWINSEGIISIVFPYPSNKKALGKSLFEHPFAKETFEKAYSTQTVQVTPIIPLLQGGNGIAFYYPVVRNGKLIGFVNGVFNVDTLFIMNTVPILRNDIYLTIAQDNKIIYPFGMPEKSRKTGSTREIKVLDKIWKIRVIPRPVTKIRILNLHFSITEYLLSWILGILLSVLYYKSRILGLSREKMRKRMREILGVRPYVIIVTDEHGNIVFANDTAKSFFGSELIGKSIKEIGLLFERKESVQKEIELQAENRRRLLLLDIFAIKDENGVEYCYLAQDRTELLEEKRKLKAQTELLKSYGNIRLKILSEKEFEKGIRKALRLLKRVFQAEGVGIYVKSEDRHLPVLLDSWSARGLKLPEKPDNVHPVTLAITLNIMEKYRKSGLIYFVFPLRSMQQVVGALLIVKKEENINQELITLMQYDIGYYIHMYSLLRRLEKRQEELQNILEIAKIFVNSSTVKEGFERTANFIESMTGAISFAVLRRTDGNSVEIVYAHSQLKPFPKAGDILDASRYYTLPKALKDWKPHILEDFDKINIKDHVIKFLKAKGIRSILYYPLSGPRRRTYILVLSGRQKNQFGEATIEVLKNLDELLSSFLETMELVSQLEYSRSFMECLYHFTIDASHAKNVEEVDRILIDHIFNYLKPDSAALLYVNEEKQEMERITFKLSPELEHLQAYFEKNLPQKIPFGDNPVTAIYRKKEPLLSRFTIKCIEHIPDEIKEYYCPRSLLGIPLMVDGKVRAILAMHSKSPDFFKEGTEDAAVTLMNTYESILKNIYQKKELEFNLREISLIFDNVDLGIAVIDEDFRIKEANQTFLKLLSSENKNILGQLCFTILHGRNTPMLWCPIKKLIESGGKESASVEFFEKHIHRFIRVQAQFLYEKDGKKHFIYTLRDITEARDYENLLLALFEGTAEISTCTSLEELVSNLNKLIYGRLKFKEFGLFLDFNPEMKLFNISYFFEEGKEAIRIPPHVVKLALYTYTNRESISIKTEHDAEKWRKKLGPDFTCKGNCICMPLLSGKEAMGVIYLRYLPEQEITVPMEEAIRTLVYAISIGLNNLRLLKDLHKALENLKKSYTVTLEIISRILDQREHETQNHSIRVALYAVRIGMELRLSQRELVELYWGGLLHDIGKIGIPDSILLKKGRLDDEEWKKMEEHPIIGYNIVAHLELLGKARDVVKYHHEKWNGQGYPEGLRNGMIPLLARIFAVADAYDAMTSYRPYRKALSHEYAVREIREKSGEQFDPMVVDAFLRIPKEELEDIRRNLRVPGMPEFKLF